MTNRQWLLPLDLSHSFACPILKNPSENWQQNGMLLTGERMSPMCLAVTGAASKKKHGMLMTKLT